jgi:hypothetical protein
MLNPVVICAPIVPAVIKQVSRIDNVTLDPSVPLSKHEKLQGSHVPD